MDVRVGLWRRLSTEILMFLNCGIGEDSWESLALQADPTSPFWRRSALGLLWKKTYDQPRQHIKKQRNINLPTKVHLVKAMVFSVAMYWCESWTTKKDECRRVDVFELWYWRRLLRVPWTAKGSNQSILKEIRTKYSLEGLMLKLKLQSFGHLMWRTD